ncbi:MAG TPA: Eco57I restriction-modification methylase domain-containing protein [Solirubrobacteraceae bacterium]|nr:Eco57I restriction-modification methylase domain-containing protein [Solirubrobacteraceae bacterium]
MPVEATGLSASAKALAEASPEEIGIAYVGALDPSVRARHGRHYTPSNLAVRLWTMMRGALGHVRGKAGPLSGLVRDPACGGGALLLPALREHLHASAHADPRLTLAGLPNVIEGIDLDPAAVWIANVLLASEALPLLAATAPARRRPLPALAHIGDGLAVAERPARAVVMNPPYGRVRLSPEERERFAHVLYGHANLYSMFMAAGLDQLDRDGVMGALVPTSFTAGLYFSNLRAELARVAPLRETTFVEERDGVFAGVLQETCLAVFSKRRARRTKVASMNGQVTEIAQVRSPRGPAPWVLPRRSDDAHIAAAASSMPLSLASSGWRVSTGPLVWNRRRDDLYAKAGERRRMIVWAADLDGGTLHRDRQRDDVRYIELRDERDEGVLSLAAPALLVQRTTAPEQQRRLVCAELTSDALTEWGGSVVVENHVNVVRPRTASNAPLISQAALQAVLSTKCIDRVVRCFSGSVALSAYELEALPLPDASTLAAWEGLRGDDLEHAVAAAYRP